VAAHQGLSESALLRRLVERSLAVTEDLSLVQQPPSVARNARVTVRLVPHDSLLLRERAQILRSQIRVAFELMRRVAERELRDFAVLGPAEGGGTMRERAALAVQNCTAAADADGRGLARRSVGVMALGQTSHSCLLYVSPANAKLPLMPENSPETSAAEMPEKIGISHNKTAEKIDRRISVAPMIDWTDEVAFAF
jgi:hypothetical protein